MVRPTPLLRALAESSTTHFDNIRPLKVYSRYQLNKDVSTATKKPKHLIISDIPKTATPLDVLRELRSAGAVGEDFSVMNIAPMPPSIPHKPMLTRSFHLTLPSPTQADTVAKLLNTSPLFPASFPPTNRTYAPLARIQFTPSTAAEWRGNLCLAAEAALARRTYRPLNTGPTGGGGKFGFAEREQDVVRYDADWIGEQGVSGRRVVLQGYPYGTGVARLKGWIEEKHGGVTIGSGLEEGENAIVKLPSSPGRKAAIFGLTFKTVADATRAARRLNMTIHQQTRFGNVETIIRAEVVW